MHGSSPSNGVLYTGSFALPDPANVQAIAFATNGAPSQPVSRTINRLPTSAIGPNHLRIVSRSPSVVSLILRGTANRRYVLERSTDLRTWTAIASTIAPLDGLARMKDTSAPASQAFYRAIEK